MAARCFPLWQRSSGVMSRLGCVLQTSSAGYAKKIGVGSGKAGTSISPKIEMEVETDPEKLVKYCCGANIYVTGQDPELKPDSEYPDWLWTLRTDRKPPDLSELDPDSFYYWDSTVVHSDPEGISDTHPDSAGVHSDPEGISDITSIIYSGP
ncbi:large ribosomal subunit protein mL54-like [Liolophura sinensis]|uniref:large ribosomal subunit protein mL54-like n=1 Tax=Liolophura sinensis TaxID=3198878 RepID=UPI0031590457